MGIIVKKFGGTSVSAPEVREQVYAKIESELATGNQVVAVISAMGRRGAPYATDTILDMILAENPDARQRELDFAAVCGEFLAGCVVSASLQKRGHKAVYLSGLQAGIICNGVYGDARIMEIRTDHLLGLLQEGYLPIVAGGQGGTDAGEICTLGRGSSDTSGVALGVALQAERTEIFTDVDGIMTGDPRIINNARIIRQLSYENCIEMAYQGAKVMHPRAVETAALLPTMELYVRSTTSNDPGTLVCSRGEQTGLAGVALQENQHLVQGSLSKDLQERMAVEEIIPLPLKTKEPLLAVAAKEYKRFIALAQQSGVNYPLINNAAKISLVGTGISQIPDLEERCRKALQQAGIPILYSHTTAISHSVWVVAQAVEGANLLHDLLLP
ncbi:MAG: aspartate kinase [Symbiobacteriaceae bacterium]|nr:aspartate kinase [Symbiobacteriaceae bacterium]